MCDLVQHKIKINEINFGINLNYVFFGIGFTLRQLCNNSLDAVRLNVRKPKVTALTNFI